GLRFYLKGEFIEIMQPSFFGCILFVKKGIVQLGLKVTFELRSANHKTTRIICRAMEEKGTTTLVRFVVGIPEQYFARSVFDSIKRRLEQIA
ncbi:MAG: hypothetical protein WAW96_19710, partial [Alphaproteobacteria bacterium]